MKKLIALLALLGATHAFAGGLPTTPYIYVQGSAETKVAPDTLVLSFSVNAQDKDQVVAKKTVSEKSAAVFDLLEKSGFKDDAITAQDLSVNSNFDYVAGQRVHTGYNVSRQFSVKFTDFSLYAKLADALVALRIDSLNPVQASFADARGESAKLKSVALANARKEADDLAASLNATVTGVFAASPIPFPEISGVIFGSSGPQPVRAMSLDMRAAKNDGDKYVFDDITLSERLHVIFLIQPKS
jgi:uncharacterized protein YggE